MYYIAVVITLYIENGSLVHNTPLLQQPIRKKDNT